MTDNKGNALLVIIIIIAVIVGGYFLISKKTPPVDTGTAGGTMPALLGNTDDFVSFSIAQGQEVSGKMTATGSVKNAYFFELNIVVNILDANKNLLRAGNGQATTEWMTSDPVSFTTNLDFTGLPKGIAYIELHNDNASGLPENDKSILIPVVIN